MLDVKEYKQGSFRAQLITNEIGTSVVLTNNEKIVQQDVVGTQLEAELRAMAWVLQDFPTGSVYLAGPQVFGHGQPVAYYPRMEALLQGRRMRAIVPSDGGLSTGALAGADTAKRIMAENMVKICNSDFVLADVSPFRGSEPDAGTCFEIGYACAQGIPVFAYSKHTGAYLDQVQAVWGIQKLGVDRYCDMKENMLVENMGLKTNLMIACSVTALTSSAEEAVLALCKYRLDQIKPDQPVLSLSDIFKRAQAATLVSVRRY